MNKEDIQSIFESLQTNHDAESVALYQSIIEAVEIDSFDEPRDFSLISSKWDSFVNGLLTVTIGDSEDLKFLYSQYDFVEGYFKKIFEMFEGAACSADKSRTVIQALTVHYQTGEVISFNYQQRYTYHLPEKILKTHEQIVRTYRAIRCLYYRNPFKFFRVLADLNKQLSTTGKMQ